MERLDYPGMQTEVLKIIPFCKKNGRKTWSCITEKKRWKLNHAINKKKQTIIMIHGLFEEGKFKISPQICAV